MAATPDHGSLDQDVQGIHVPFQYLFADEASRIGAPASRLSGGASKFAYESGTCTLWILAETTPNPTWASIGGGAVGGGVDEAANLGTGIGVFREKSGGSFLFKTLVATEGVTLSSAASTITITGATSEALTDVTNLGTGFPIFREKQSSSAILRTLVGGTNVTLTSAASTITITAASLESAGSIGNISVTIGASNTWNNELIPIWQAPRGTSVQLVEMDTTTSGTNTPTLSFNLQRRDFGAMNSAGVDIFAASQTADADGLSQTSFGTSVLGPKNHLMFTTGSGAEGGSVNYLHITMYYHVL